MKCFRTGQKLKFRNNNPKPLKGLKIPMMSVMFNINGKEKSSLRIFGVSVYNYIKILLSTNATLPALGGDAEGRGGKL